MTTEEKLKALAELRAANRALAERQAKEIAERRTDDEIAYETARGEAYAKHGAARVLGGEIKGAGFVALHWPNEIEWKHFVNRGILKKDSLTVDLCKDLCQRCLVYPTLARFDEICQINPNAPVKLAEQIMVAMRPEVEAEGNG